MTCIDKQGRLFECKENNNYLPHCYHCSWDYLFRLGKKICGDPDKHSNCLYRKEIKNYQKKIKNYTSDR